MRLVDPQTPGMLFRVAAENAGKCRPSEALSPIYLSVLRKMLGAGIFLAS